MNVGDWGKRSERLKFRSSAERFRLEAERRRSWTAHRIPYGVEFLDDITRGILPSDLILLGAHTGAGKTALASMIAQGAALAGQRVFFLALEADEGEIERRIRYRHIASALEPPATWRLRYVDWCLGLQNELTRDVEDEVTAELERLFVTHHTLYRVSEQFDTATLAATLREIRDRADLVVLDHLHYVDSDNANEHQAMRDTVKAIRDAALTMGVPMLVLAHLRKKDRSRKLLVPELDDFHGTSDIVKIATRVIVLAPAWDQAEGNKFAPTYAVVRKDRLCGTTAFAGLLHFDVHRWTYKAGYTLGRLSTSGDAWHKCESEDLPYWAVSEWRRQHDHTG